MKVRRLDVYVYEEHIKMLLDLRRELKINNLSALIRKIIEDYYKQYYQSLMNNESVGV